MGEVVVPTSRWGSLKELRSVHRKGRGRIMGEVIVPTSRWGSLKGLRSVHRKDAAA